MKARSLNQVRDDQRRRADSLTLDDRRRGVRKSAAQQTRNARGKFTGRKP